ncbi:MAG: Sporulation related domain [Rhodospirillales bacterium]|nr:Sporulation related domain [Rhodospirillales bacterium]
MGYGIDRTFSAQQWRVVVFSACAVLIAGVGLGILIGRLTAPPPDPPPASASILPDVLPSDAKAASPTASNDEDLDEPPPLPPPAIVVAAPAPAPVVKAPPAAPVVQKTVPPPEKVAAAPKPQHPVPPKRIEGKPKPLPAEPGPPTDGGRWVVQLGAFQSSDHANLLVNTLAAHGQPAHVSFARNAAGQDWFYVQTLPYRSAAAAKNAAQGLAAREHLPTYLVKLPDPG